MAPSRSLTRDVRKRDIHFDSPVSLQDRTVRGLAAVVTDLDRTLLPPSGRTTTHARRALRGIRALGLKALLVSGRTYADLTLYAPKFGTWDGLVAENGAVVEAPIGAPPFVLGRRRASVVRARMLADPRLHPELGEVIASVPRRERRALRDALVGLRVDLVPNIDRLMVLPAGVSKRTGVHTALRRLGMPGAGYAAIGDAENDRELLERAEYSAAVANAIPAVRAHVDYVCRGSFDRGVLEFVDGPLRDRVRAEPSARKV